MRTVAIVQARTTSERFPCKILASLYGRPMLAHVLERASAIQGVDQVVLAVPENDVRIVSHLWPHVFGGSEKDVLGRYAKCAEQYEADVIVRITGDCPLLAPDIAEAALFYQRLADGRYVAACQPYSSSVADGWDVEVFDRRTLVNADRFAKKEQREHVTTWMREATSVSSIAEMSEFSQFDSTALKCSVDDRTDLQRVEKIMTNLEDKTDFSHQATWRAWERAGRP